MLLRKPTDAVRVQQLAGRIKTNVQRMSLLINDVLDFARGKLGGGIGVNVDEVDDLQSGLESVVKELQDGQPGRQILSNISVTRKVRCDLGRVQQVASNLIGNALSHGSADTPVRVTARTDERNLVLDVWRRRRPRFLQKAFQKFSSRSGVIPPRLPGKVWDWVCIFVRRSCGLTTANYQSPPRQTTAPPSLPAYRCSECLSTGASRAAAHLQCCNVKVSEEPSSNDRELLRLDALDSYRILDTAREAAFDDIVSIAAEICGVPMALVSLVDDRRQWFKAALGLDATETPRSVAFCAHAIQQSDVFVVEDATQDVRFSENPLVTSDPNLRFYAGAQLVTADGHALGTLCVLDRQPRTLTATQHLALKALARQVMMQMELRKSLEDTRLSEEKLRRAQEAGGVGLFAIELASDQLSGTPEFWRIFGFTGTLPRSASIINELVIVEDRAAISTRAARDLGDTTLQAEYRIRRADTGELRWIERNADYERDATGQRIRLTGVVRDITERRMAQRDAEANAAQFKSYTQTLPNHAWSATAAGAADWFNDRVYEYSGLEPAQAYGRGWMQMIHPEDRSMAAERWASAIESGEIHEMESRLRRVDGEYRWHLTRAIPMRSPEGRISRWIGTNTDIHERKLVETEAVVERDRIWTLSQEIMLVCDFSGVISAVNPAATRILGYRQEDMVGRRVAEFIHPDDVARSASELGKLSHGIAVSVQDRYVTADGNYRLLDWTAVAAQGRVHAIARDITRERAMAEDREHIWNSTNDLMATLGRDGYLKAVNPAWGRLLGYDDRDLLSHPFIEHIAPEDRPNLKRVLSRLAAGESVRNLEDRLRHKDGTQSVVAWSAEPVNDLYYIVGRNVTEQRATEDALRQSLKMEAVGQLTGGIAHDFNNLLQGITGSLDLIKKRTLQGRYSEVERYVTNAMSSATRAAALTHRLLAFSRRQPLSPKAVEVNPLIMSMEDLLRRTLGEHIKLEIVLGGSVWLTKCDRNQLENAVLNLVINARDAMPNGGILTVESANVHLDRAYAAKNQDIEPGQYVRIGVTDTGSGMSADTIAKAFEPFFTTKPLGRGTGLGLSMIYGFAKQSGGYAKIYSEINKGTTVKLYLPRFRGDAEREEVLPTPTAENSSLRNEVVLVVEDEFIVRQLIVEILNELGYRALEAEDGPSGLCVLQSSERIDLLITDIGLPGLNGRQIVEAARLQRPELKVLFMTGYAENAAIASGFLEAGMSMITKPFAMDELASRIREMLEGR